MNHASMKHLSNLIKNGWVESAQELIDSALAQGEQAEKQEFAVQYLWECIGCWSSYLAVNGTQANMAPPNWLLDAVKAATSQPSKPWVSLTDEDRNPLIIKCAKYYGYEMNVISASGFYVLARDIESALRRKNNG